MKSTNNLNIKNFIFYINISIIFLLSILNNNNVSCNYFSAISPNNKYLNKQKMHDNNYLYYSQNKNFLLNNNRDELKNNLLSNSNIKNSLNNYNNIQNISSKNINIYNDECTENIYLMLPEIYNKLHMVENHKSYNSVISLYKLFITTLDTIMSGRNKANNTLNKNEISALSVYYNSLIIELNSDKLYHNNEFKNVFILCLEYFNKCSKIFFEV